MNANELIDININKLADDLEKASNDMEHNIYVSDWVLLFESAVVLRQQKTEIDKLKNLVLDNQTLLDKTLNAWAKEMEKRK